MRQGEKIWPSSTADILMLLLKPANLGRLRDDILDYRPRTLDIRVDDHPAPLQEMRRLVTKYLAYEAANAAIAKAESGDLEGAFDGYASAIQLQPEELQLRIWGWVPLILADRSGKLDRVASLLKPLLRADEKWVRLVERYLEVRPLKTPGLMEEVLALAGPTSVV